ncbi:hypothetical protein AGDE_01727 [Angomonas deanei]|uniref:Pyridine nucleotide-disulphide oxidoreductase, putative n=1 Tax=Angomonas deanei TaxID=59799 RepID=A0A7G2CML4_9TRYP|nr:hypothetical protein AGDE_01727 [Angomonas deanei]CAD2220307.1 Pyridine nucleotide-disulphide oxidoreductase, putative [Angomonas deanei]|eukprot:EPY42196.1 hypothetical protein AGDE_01727 [Angomonas deanei]
MNPAEDVTPVRAVVVGGGYCGSRVAYQLDSMFDVTYIDTKNFFELTNDIIPIIANPWEEGKSEEACRRMMILHRYYLKRTNVLTGKVDGVDDKQVYLKDGRSVPYDLLMVTVGEKKSFPFSTKQRTISGRVQELRHFNEFLQTCNKVAVVGGGPVGVSLAQDLAAARPELDVHLYHSHDELLPSLPGVCRRYALDKLRSNENLTVHLNNRVTEVSGYGGDGKRIDPPAERTPSFWGKLLGWNHSQEDSFIPGGAGPTKYNLTFDRVQYAAREQQSIISQVFLGRKPEVINDGEVVGSGSAEGFDYVFSLSGDTARPVVASGNKPNILKDHETPDGHYRTSTLLQLFNRPNIFVAGRCTNFPITKGYGSSDIQARTLFRELTSIISNPTAAFLHSRDGLQLYRMKVPRLHVRLGVGDGVGCTPWSGGMTAGPAVLEFHQDRNYLIKEFQRPVFYKQQNQSKIKLKIDQWLAHEITDITDFSHC